MGYPGPSPEVTSRARKKNPEKWWFRKGRRNPASSLGFGYFSGAFSVKTLGGYTLEHCHDFFLEHQQMGGDCTDFKLSGLEVNRPWLPGIFSNVSNFSYTDG